MDGEQVLRELEQLRTTTPIVISSGYNTQHLSQELTGPRRRSVSAEAVRVQPDAGDRGERDRLARAAVASSREGGFGARVRSRRQAPLGCQAIE